jgi:hypothetical protein
MEAAVRWIFGFWFTRRQEGRKKGQAFKAVFVSSCLRALEAERRRETGCRTHTLRMKPKPEQRMKIFLDKRNHIGYSSQRFLTLCSGEQGKERETRGFHHKWDIRTWSAWIGAVLRTRAAHIAQISAYPSGKAFSLETG